MKLIIIRMAYNTVFAQGLSQAKESGVMSATSFSLGAKYHQESITLCPSSKALQTRERYIKSRAKEIATSCGG